MYTDFHTIFRQMRAGTFDHAAFKRMNDHMHKLAADYERGAISREECALSMKAERTVYEIKQRHHNMRLV